MASTTIDYGIHLGMTEAMIARCRGSEVEVFRNAEGFESTPCAVWLDRQGKLVVGRVAKERCEGDPDNAFMEFIRQMGTPHEYTFAGSGRKMRPEELSAEVLKSLRWDVERRIGKVPSAAVITVPADFDLPACEATKRAAHLAGFRHSLLLQEPIATALAYGFDREPDGTSWLIYDLGAGTFDASVVRMQEGWTRVVGHEADNHLGSRNFVWAVVEQLLIPLLTKKHSLPDFRRGIPKWRGPIAKLRIQAEAAMLRLDTAENTEIGIDFLCSDGHGKPVEFNYELERPDVERLLEPFILRTARLCNEAVAAARLPLDAISRVILVGGATLHPFVRKILRSPACGLELPLEFSIDPFTVLVRGAAIFAASQLQPCPGPGIPVSNRAEFDDGPVSNQ
jgi:molecular chaperone DnaK